MSKRGSSSAKFIGGKSWKVGSKGSNVPKHLKKVKANSKKQLLGIQFYSVAESFGFSSNDSNLASYLHSFINDFTPIKQELYKLNLAHFKAFAEKTGLDFSLTNYFDNKYYLKDYNGLAVQMGFNFENLQRKELIDNYFEIGKKDIIKKQKEVILSHLDFLIYHSKRL